jgi:hypothetical protein
MIGEIESRTHKETGVERVQHIQLWELGITELAGHNIETQGREEVNKMLKEGWVLLHIYTLHYNDDGVWRQRPMAILGSPQRADT